MRRISIAIALAGMLNYALALAAVMIVPASRRVLLAVLSKLAAALARRTGTGEAAVADV